MAAPPQWAQDLVIRVAIDEGRDDLPDLTWRRGPHLGSQGSYYGDRQQIIVTAGKDRMAQRLTLLHEVAHWLMPQRIVHAPAFWDKAWELYRRYKVPVRFALRIEGIYRKGAILAYRRSMEV